MIFSDAFLAIEPKEIAERIRHDGIVAFEGALTEAFLDQIDSDVSANRFDVNRNMVTGVYFHRQYFLTHMLAVSKAFFDYCTHPKVLDVSEAVLGRDFRLSALRYYEAYGGHHSLGTLEPSTKDCAPRLRWTAQAARGWIARIVPAPIRRLVRAVGRLRKPVAS